jgi:hypothetical protein
MQNGKVVENLGRVRHELDMLNSARMMWDLGPGEFAQYQELCRIERELLATPHIAA